MASKAVIRSAQDAVGELFSQNIKHLSLESISSVSIVGHINAIQLACSEIQLYTECVPVSNTLACCDKMLHCERST